MTEHKTGTRDEWRAARLELLQAEKELTRRNDDLARRRRELPWVRLDKDYHFDTEGGEATISGLFGGRSQLLVYHFMFDPDWDQGCPSCSSIADGFNGSVAAPAPGPAGSRPLRPAGPVPAVVTRQPARLPSREGTSPPGVAGRTPHRPVAAPGR